MRPEGVVWGDSEGATCVVVHIYVLHLAEGHACTAHLGDDPGFDLIDHLTQHMPIF